jgi:His/Glu/Gln/Arg/opine family amino acid ABC transporter permease subunit
VLKLLWSKIYNTFIFDNRYLFFLNGLKVTLQLTFASFILGTLTGILICAASRSRYKWLRKLASFFVTIFTEIPTMMLLMIFVYIIFGRSALPLLWIVAIGLTLKAGAYLSVIFNSSLETVAAGEVEAARTLGMSRWQAFQYVTLPQTVAAALPLYKNQFIVSMQETSVVGYLAIVDLTRASSIIQSRTLDAFFGLVTVTLTYFLIGGLMKKLFKLVSIKLGGEEA